MPDTKRGKRISLYPLKFDEVISDVLKVKPEPKRGRAKANRTRDSKPPTKRAES
jgi:hypothetical protein